LLGPGKVGFGSTASLAECPSLARSNDGAINLETAKVLGLTIQPPMLPSPTTQPLYAQLAALLTSEVGTHPHSTRCSDFGLLSEELLPRRIGDRDGS